MLNYNHYHCYLFLGFNWKSSEAIQIFWSKHHLCYNGKGWSPEKWGSKWYESVEIYCNHCSNHVPLKIVKWTFSTLCTMCKSRNVGLATFWQKFRETSFIADEKGRMIWRNFLPWDLIFRFSTVCENYGLLSHFFFWKNFVKTTSKLNSWFDEIFFRQQE